MSDIPSEIRDVFAKATCLHTKFDIECALEHMATSISYSVSHKNPVFICVMIGGMVTMGNLLTHLDFPLEVDYIDARRYDSGLVGKDIQFRVQPTTTLKDRTVVIVDDILDGGVTLAHCIDYCKSKGAREILTAVLVDKVRESREKNGVEKADFVALKVPNDYVFGYGLDYKEYLRNAPGIYKVAPEHQ
jgi:hypoxanthine phosphoribosyltransferase